MKDMIKGKRIPVIRTSTKEETIKVLENLNAVNCNVVELTFSIPEIETYFGELLEKFDDMVIGIGTVTDTKRAKLAIDMNAAFIVSPNFDENVSEMCKEAGKMYVPGCLTPTEILRAYNLGNEVVKLFPSNLFGFGYFKTLASLFPHVDFLTSGGVNHENVTEWEELALCVGIGGSYFNNIMEQTNEELQSKWKFLGETNE